MIKIKKGAKKPWKVGDVIQVAANQNDRDYPYRVKFNGKVYAVQSVSLKEVRTIAAPQGLSNSFCTYAMEGCATPSFKKIKAAIDVRFTSSGMNVSTRAKQLHLGAPKPDAAPDRYAIL